MSDSVCTRCGAPVPEGQPCPACSDTAFQRHDEDLTAAFSAERRAHPASSSEATDIVLPGYRILQRLGQGGMGAVYLALDESLDRKVAIKVVSDRIARDPEAHARFLREARLLATVEHSNVVRIYSFESAGERTCMVMEYVEGETLARRIARTGPIPADEALQILLQIVDALDAAWEKRIVHRDIKPLNIIFDKRGTVKVADFGLAKGMESSSTEQSLTHTGYLMGSPHYIAPEQAQGHRTDFRADNKSLGILF